MSTEAVRGTFSPPLTDPKSQDIEKPGSGKGGLDSTSKDANSNTVQLDKQTAAFDALEQDFRQVLSELVGDKSLERFRVEYEKLHQALKRSHENEKKLIKKCRELNSEIVVNAAKVQAALRMSRSDQNNITLLKKEIDNAWKIVDAAQEKEKRAKETIQRLKGEIEKLSRIVDQGAGLSIGQENAVNELMRQKEELTKELEAQRSLVQQEGIRTRELTLQLQEAEAKTMETERELHEMKDLVSKTKIKAERETRRAERLQAEILTLKDLSDARKTQLTKKDDEVEEMQQQLSALAMSKKEIEYALDKYRDVAEELRLKNEELEKSVGYHIQRETSLASEKEAIEAELTLKREEMKKKANEVQLHMRRREKTEQEKEKLEAAKSEAESQRDQLKSELTNVQKDVELQARNADVDENLIKDLQGQVKRLTASLAASKEKNKMQLGLVRSHEEMKKALEQDILRHKAEEERLRRRNYELEKQREKAAMSASTWHVKHQEAVETTKMKDMENAELSKKVTEEKTKNQLQQQIYEQVRADRNLFSKQHIQSQDEIAEMKRKFKIMAHQIEQLKEEIQGKDRALINEHFAYKRLKDEMKVLKRKLAKREEVLATADQVLASQDAEIKNLRRTLLEAEAAQRQQKAVYDDVVQERDILGTQLIRRNDELALLYEKIRIQQSTLNKGELQYRERLQEIHLLKLKVNDLKRELQIRTHEVANVDALKEEIQRIQRELLQERTKVKALSEELENPMNVHRWRKLEGSDPQRFELIQKIQTLQKRLIQKTEDCVEKDLLLQEKERLYLELKNILARQPGPEVAEQLSIYQQSLKEKTRQMKAMAAELNMMQAQVNEYRFELERITRELQDSKRKNIEWRKKDQAARGDSSLDPLQQQQQQFLMTQPRIAGGGFNLSALAYNVAAQMQAKEQQFAATAPTSVNASVTPGSPSGAGSPTSAGPMTMQQVTGNTPRAGSSNSNL